MIGVHVNAFAEPFEATARKTGEKEELMGKVKKTSTQLGLALMFILAATIFSSSGETAGSLDALPGFLRGTAIAAEEPRSDDKTLSPYFVVKSDDPDIDRLPLKSTSVAVKIAGVIADIRVVQVYQNESKRPLEAVYVFPASTKAAVYGMKMIVGERTIVAEVQKREEARRNYEQAKAAGRSTSLLEQQRPNVFQMNVANIMPGDEIRTELSYTELLTPSEGVYEFIYPTVVGPRYSNQPAATAPASEKWVANPYLHQGEPPDYSLDISADLAAGLPIKSMVSPSHKVEIVYAEPSRATVKLDPSDSSAGNRDFILKYRLAGDRISSGLLLYEGEDENFFLLMTQPPEHVVPSEIPPREYIFVVDTSGSMHGFPLSIAKRLLKDLIGNLRPTDLFNVLLFSGSSYLMAEQSVPATAENVRRATQVIDRQRGGGGTELLPALKRAFTLPEQQGTARTLVLVTDGYVTIETEAFDLIRSHVGRANFFAFGIGTSVNRYLIEGMARVGGGEPFVITKPDEARQHAERFRRYLQAPVLTHVKVDFGGFDAYEVEPSGVPDVFSERPVIVFGKWKGGPDGPIVLSGISGGGQYEQRIDVAGVKPLSTNSALRYLWSRARIAQLSDYNRLELDDGRIETITALALKYNLLSAYTSFVAIDKQVRNQGGHLTTVSQPLPLPQGVSDYAVGETAAQSVGLAKMPAMPLAASPLVSSALRSEGNNKGAKDSSEPKRLGRVEGNESDLQVRLGKMTLAGELSMSAVRGLLEHNLIDITQCFSESIPHPTGEVVVRWSVGRDGHVEAVEVIHNGIDSKAVEKCLIAWIKKQKYTVTPAKGDTTITASFVFGSA